MIELIRKGEIAVDSYCARLDLKKIFDRLGPLHVDLGCGDGSFLLALAQGAPDKNFLGIERLAGRVEKACRKAATVANMRVLHLESSYAVRYLLPAHSVAVFYLMFPDPWPKRRHHRRRLVTPEFLNSIHAALEKDGILRIATDHSDYVETIRKLGRSDTGFRMVDPNDLDLPVTKFERDFRDQGAAIYRLALQKTSSGT